MDRRSSVSWLTVSPRYSVSTAADDPRNASAISATAASLSDLAIALLRSGRQPQAGVHREFSKAQKIFSILYATPAQASPKAFTAAEAATGGLWCGGEAIAGDLTSDLDGDVLGDALGAVGVDGDARAHRRAERDLPQVATLGGRRLGTQHLIENGRVVLRELLLAEAGLADHQVQVGLLVDAEVDL